VRRTWGTSSNCEDGPSVTFTLTLVALLALISGVIAFAGDRLGAYVGRRRLTLFGARPRLTGQIVGVVAGILIMLSTLTVLSLAFRSATQVLLDAQRVAQELNALQALERSLRGELSSLTRQQDALQADLRAARDTIDRAEASRDAALAERDRLRFETDELGAEVAVAEQALAEANELLAALDVELASAETALAQADAQRIAAIIEREIAQVQVDELVGHIDVLVRQAQELESLAGQLLREAERLQSENASLQSRNDQLGLSNADLQSRNANLLQLNEGLQAEILAGNEQVSVLEGQVLVLNERLEDEARRLADLQLEFSRVASGEVTFVRDQVIYSGALSANTLEGAREELAAFVRDANESIALRGAGVIELSAEQFEGLAQVIAETQGSDLVRFISPRNQFDPVRVAVVVEAVENERIFNGGQLLLSRTVHMGDAELPASLEEVRGWIAQLRSDTIRHLRRSGLDELQAPRFTGVSEEAFANQLMRLSGPVTIGVISVGAIDRAGPAWVEYLIVY